MKSALVVVGAATAVGRGVLQAAIAAGRPVVAVAGDARLCATLRAAYADADLVALRAPLHQDSTGAELGATLRELARPLAGVIAVVAASDARGRLLDQPAAVLRRQLDAQLLPHLIAARHLLPLLAQANRGGSYVLIGGPGSEHPWAGHGYRSIAGAALQMLARVLHDEALALSVRLQLLAVDSPIRTDANAGCACPQWPTALEVGERALALIDATEAIAPTGAIVRHSARRGQTPSSTARTAAAQDPDSPSTPLPARCLQDARTLLQTLAFFKSKQERPR